MNRFRKMTYQGIVIVTLLLTVSAIILTVFAVILLNRETPDADRPLPVVNAAPEPSKTPTSASADPDPGPAPRYTVILEGGELRLRSGGQYTVLRGIDPRTLRQADREVLQAGLALGSEEELARFLEDFGS